MDNLSPKHLRAIRAKALKLAVASSEPGGHMVTFARRAHYFAHYIADGTRNELCQDDKDCPFATVLVPEKRD